MGWLFKPGISRKDLIAENTQGSERTKDDGTVIKLECLAHCYRGGVFSGVLWSVWERTFVKDRQQVEPPQRWIVCDLLRYVDGEWGYKDMEESMHPFFYSCPLKYLDLVPIEQFGGNPEWRGQVHEYHARIALPGRRHGKDESDTRLIVVRQIIHPNQGEQHVRSNRNRPS